MEKPVFSPTNIVMKKYGKTFVTFILLLGMIASSGCRKNSQTEYVSKSGSVFPVFQREQAKVDIEINTMKIGSCLYFDDNTESHFADIYPSRNGLYIVYYGNNNLGSEEKSSDGKWLLRLNDQKEVLWRFQLEETEMGENYRNLSSNTVLVDKDENIYIQGRVYSNSQKRRSFQNIRNVYGNIAPKGKDYWIVKISSEGEFCWIQFYTLETYLKTMDHESNEIIGYQMNEASNKWTAVGLALYDGSILWEKTIMDSTFSEWLYPVSNGFCLISEKKEETDISLIFKMISNRGESLWSQSSTLSIPWDIQNTVLCNILSSECETCTYFSITYQYLEEKFKSTSFPIQQTTALLAFSKQGDLIWQKTLTEQLLPLALECNEDKVCIAGETASTKPYSNVAFQPDNNGEHDVFINMFSKDGENLWNTYLGGAKWEPYCWVDSSFERRYADLHIQLTDNLLFVSCSTSSTDYPVTTTSLDKDLTSASHDGGNGVLSLFNMDGQLEYSTYLTKGGRFRTSDFEKNGASTRSMLDKDGWIFDAKVYDSKLYVLYSSVKGQSLSVQNSRKEEIKESDVSDRNGESIYVESDSYTYLLDIYDFYELMQ